MSTHALPTSPAMTRRSLVLSAAGAASLALAGCSASAAAPTVDDTSDTLSGTLTKALDNGFDTGLHHAALEVEGHGTLTLELNASNAPITVSNFADLVTRGFYDGLTFHRIIKGFMAQGGDPKGDGTGGSGRTIMGEFGANGVVNAIRHERGVISMARSSENDSASSQFFIVQQDASSLDGNYAAFGRVTDGMDVIDDICETTPVTDNNGTVAPDRQPKISSIRMLD